MNIYTAFKKKKKKFPCLRTGNEETAYTEFKRRLQGFVKCNANQ